MWTESNYNLFCFSFGKTDLSGVLFDFFHPHLDSTSSPNLTPTQHAYKLGSSVLLDTFKVYLHVKCFEDKWFWSFCSGSAFKWRGGMGKDKTNSINNCINSFTNMQFFAFILGSWDGKMWNSSANPEQSNHQGNNTCPPLYR